MSLSARTALTRGMIVAVLTIAAAVTLLPFAWVFFGSFRTTADILANPGAMLPTEFSVANYVELFAERGFGTYLANSIVTAAIVVLGNLTFATLAGYSLAKLRFRGKRLVVGMVMAALIAPYISLFIPQFMITVRLGLIDTLLGIALPMLILPIGVFIITQFGQSIPDELLEAARIDGASELRIFWSVFLPLLRPALATVVIFTFLASWNNFLWPLIVGQSNSSFTLPVGLAAVSQQARTVDYGMMLSAAMILVIPVLILFLLLQRHFVRGVVMSGLK